MSYVHNVNIMKVTRQDNDVFWNIVIGPPQEVILTRPVDRILQKRAQQRYACDVDDIVVVLPAKNLPWLSYIKLMLSLVLSSGRTYQAGAV